MPSEPLSRIGREETVNVPMALVLAPRVGEAQIDRLLARDGQRQIGARLELRARRSELRGRQAMQAQQGAGQVAQWGTRQAAWRSHSAGRPASTSER